MPKIIPESEEEATFRMLEEIVKALVDAPEHVRLEILRGPEGATMRLHVADADLGKLIGKQGRTARSLRTIFGAIGMKQKRRYTLDIVENVP
jgi:hypothetical protein